MQSKGPTPSRAKRVTFDVWARSVCVHIITLMTFRLIVPSSCVFVKYLQDFCLFFLKNARVVDVFFCVPLSVVVPDVTSPFDTLWEGQKVSPLRRQMECWRDFRLLGRRGEKSIVLLFSVRCQHWQGFWMCVLMWVRFLLNRFLTVWVCFDFWPHLIIPFLHTF